VCHVTVIYLFSAKVTVLANIAIFAASISGICERTVRDMEISSMDSYYEYVYELCNDTK